MVFNKLKVEKAAKLKETDIVASNLTENRSVVRAIARFQAAKELYPEATETEINIEIYANFYAEAKWQTAWEEPFSKSSARSLGDLLKEKLSAPAVRGRRQTAVPQPVAEPDVSNPNAMLVPDTNPVAQAAAAESAPVQAAATV
jgi:hypothetical protein